MSVFGKNIATTANFRWLILSAALALIISSIDLRHLPSYTWKGIEPVYLLWVLFIVMKGIESSGLLAAISRRLESGGFLAQKMVLLSFLFSMTMTIDASLVVLMPILFSIKKIKKTQLAVLIALSAHLGSALTPFGTPQNLFIFSYYDIAVTDFIKEIAPFSIILLIILLLFSLSMKVRKPETKGRQRKKNKSDSRQALIYFTAFLFTVAAVLHIIPGTLTLIIPLAVMFFDRDKLSVDYPLLLTFLLFLGLGSNMREILSHTIEHRHHVFILSSLMSQFISNVPTTLLLMPFTDHWQALLWGSNTGGFGTPIAAMANLIAYRLVRQHSSTKDANLYLKQFVLTGSVLFFASAALFYLIHYVSI